MLSLMRAESSFDGEVQSHNLYARGSAGSREGNLADLERGVDHDCDGAHHGRARLCFLFACRSGAELRRALGPRGGRLISARIFGLSDAPEGL